MEYEQRDTRQVGQCYRFPVPRTPSFPWPIRGSVNPGKARAVTAAVVVLVLVLWWWWPGMAGGGTSIRVVVTGDVESAREEIGRRLREEGFSVRWSRAIQSWCDLDGEITDLDGAHVVLSLAGLGDCEKDASEVVESLSSTVVSRWIVIDLEAITAATDVQQRLESKGARFVATDRLIGEIDEARPCVWWEDCDGTGRTITRTETGLTADGRDRLARLITAAVV